MGKIKDIILAIYFNDPDTFGSPFTEPRYRKSYQDFSRLCKKNQIRVYFVRGNNYQGKMVFSSATRFAGDKLEPVQHQIKADIVFKRNIFKRNKGALKTEKNALIINRQELENLCENKLKTYDWFGKFMVKHFSINLKNYRQILRKISTSKVVIKPIDGRSGNNITIVDKLRFTPEILQKKQKFLAQRFIDTAGGIPGLIKGRHDLRLIVFNGKIGISYIRKPPGESLLANIAQGGKLIPVSLSQIPRSARKIAELIDKRLKHFFPRIYSIDLGYENNKPYVFELNSHPGMPFAKEEKIYYIRYHRLILKTILSALPLIKNTA